MRLEIAIHIHQTEFIFVDCSDKMMRATNGITARPPLWTH
jgi:hypothetical protein